MKLADLTTPRVNGFLDQLRDGGDRRQCAARFLRSLSSAVTFAKGRGLVAQNACQGVKVRSDGRGKTKVVIPAKSELKLLIDARRNAGGRLS